MPDVEITNPIVQIDLAAGESTTVPSGERWVVSLLGDPGFTKQKLNGAGIARGNSADTTQHVRTESFSGDTIKAKNGSLRIRGYQVEA